MDSKIRELTDRIYQDGVLKGAEQAKKIIEEAKKEAEEIIADAHNDIKKAQEKSEKDNLELKQKTEAELQLYAKQMVESLKSSVADLISVKVVNDAITSVINKPNFIEEFILELTKNFDLSEGIEISSPKAKDLINYFQHKSKNLLDNGLSIKEVGGIPTDFSISPSDGSYKIQFGEKEFEELFQSFLRPQMVKILFDK